MRRTRRGAVVLVLLIGVVALSTSAAHASWWDSLASPKQTTLAKILDNPHAFKAVPVQFTIQFHETTKFYNPFFTKFTPETHVNFAAWGDEAALWMPEDFAGSHPLFFVDKTTTHAQTILHAAPLTRLKVTGIVASTFKGEAWISVMQVKVERQALNRTSLGHIITGDKFAAEDRYNAAIQHYLKAWGSKDLPAPARAAVATRLGKSYYEVQKPVEAQPFLEYSVKTNPDDEEAQDLLNRVIGKQAGQPDVLPEPEIEGETPVPDEADPEGETYETPETDETDEPAGEGDEETPGKRLSPPR
jgi:hypothetical protein